MIFALHQAELIIQDVTKIFISITTAVEYKIRQCNMTFDLDGQVNQFKVQRLPSS